MCTRDVNRRNFAPLHPFHTHSLPFKVLLHSQSRPTTRLSVFVGHSFSSVLFRASCRNCNDTHTFDFFLSNIVLLFLLHPPTPPRLNPYALCRTATVVGAGCVLVRVLIVDSCCTRSNPFVDKNCPVWITFFVLLRLLVLVEEESYSQEENVFLWCCILLHHSNPLDCCWHRVGFFVWRTRCWSCESTHQTSNVGLLCDDQCFGKIKFSVLKNSGVFCLFFLAVCKAVRRRVCEWEVRARRWSVCAILERNGCAGKKINSEKKTTRVVKKQQRAKDVKQISAQ